MYPAPVRENVYAPVPSIFQNDPYLLDARYDDQFKRLVSAQWNVKSDGDVESPTGFFTLTEIPPGVYELRDMLDAAELSEYISEETGAPDGIAAAGWYITTENNQGQIFVYHCKGKGQAEKVYTNLVNRYIAWTEGEEL